ncbi:MAG: hypothetical protein H0W23_10235 [Chloroflexia bacterium]|nr:hypothetical protein [Chloroflexia bacterium]
MTDNHAQTPARITRRTAFAGLGAASLASTIGTPAGRVAAQGVAIEYERELVYGTVTGQELLMDVARPTDRSTALPRWCSSMVAAS